MLIEDAPGDSCWPQRVPPGMTCNSPGTSRVCTLVSMEWIRCGTSKNYFSVETFVLKFQIGYDLEQMLCPPYRRSTRSHEMSSSKEFSTAYRPSLHLVGAVCHGVCEVYFLCHADMRKDSNQNISLLCVLNTDATFEYFH